MKYQQNYNKMEFWFSIYLSTLTGLLVAFLVLIMGFTELAILLEINRGIPERVAGEGIYPGLLIDLYLFGVQAVKDISTALIAVDAG